MRGRIRAAWTCIGGMRLLKCAVMHCHVGCELLCGFAATE